MESQFRDRTEAGLLLAKKLTKYAHQSNVLVLGLPRGGVPVAYEVAQRLSAPLDVFLVRKLGVPGHEELAMGAIASGGVRVINSSVVASLNISADQIERVAKQELRELERRERAYRDDCPPLEFKRRTVIVVDDGIATGSTMYAAISALRQHEASHIVVATPVIAQSTFGQMRQAVEELVAVLIPEEFFGVGQWYEDFSQTSDDEVRALLAKAQSNPVTTL